VSGSELRFAAGGGGLREEHAASGRPLARGRLLVELRGSAPLSLGYDAAEALAGGAFAARLERPAFGIEAAFSPAAELPGWDIRLRLRAREGLELVSISCEYEFLPEGEPDCAWLPNLAPEAGDVAGQHSFRSPCAILRRGKFQLSLVPAFGPAWTASPLPRFLGLETRRGPGEPARLAFGAAGQEPRAHVFYRLTGRPARLEPGSCIELAYSLILETEADPLAPSALLRFLWSRSGLGRAASPPSPGPEPGSGEPRLELLVREALGCLVGRYGLWRDCELPGPEGPRRAGFLCVRIVRPRLEALGLPLRNDPTPRIALNYLLTPTLRLRDKLELAGSSARGLLEQAWNGLFFNQVRTAFGLAYYGGLWADEGLLAKARAMRELALAAPSAGGIFPAVLASAREGGRWVPGTRVWRFGSAYGTADAAWTGLWMLRTYRHLERDERLLGRCLELGAFLLRAQLPSGAIPAWVEVDSRGRPEARPELREGATAAAAGMFLAALADSGAGEEYRAGAARVADFLVREVFPRQAWSDPEVHYSCSPKRLGWRDRRSGIPPQGSLCLHWAAELLGSLADATGEPRYARYGRAALDLLLLHQQLWSPPFIGFRAAGGFGVMNTDAEWSDARQAQFANLLMDWYARTGEEELFLRGAAALRASFALMRRLEGDEDRGALPENYGHSGLDAPIPGYIMPDWGSGSAASSAALARLGFGDLFVDAPRGRALAVDGCRVLASSVGPGRIELELERSPGPLLMKAPGLGDALVDLIIGGRALGRFGGRELEAGILV